MATKIVVTGTSKVRDFSSLEIIRRTKRGRNKGEKINRGAKIPIFVIDMGENTSINV